MVPTAMMPCKHLLLVANVLGRVPLIPLFLAGNSTPTIPQKFSKHKGSGFPMGSADTADADGRRGCNVYDSVRSTLGSGCSRFARGKPHLGGLPVEETALKKTAVCEDQAKRSVESHRRLKAAKGLRHHRNEACVWLMSIAVRTGTYQYVRVFRYLNSTFFEKDIILAYLLHWSCTLLQFTLEELPGCMRNHHVMFLVHTSTYQYVLDKNSCQCTCMYRYIQVHTGTYR